MPAKHLMIAIDWYGPYTNKQAAREAAANFNDGLYMVVGPSGGKASLKYIGISNDLEFRMSRPHHKIDRMKVEQIWLGEISTAEPSGKRMKVTKATLDYAEWLHAYFLDLPKNEKKRSNSPKRPSTVLNRWWKIDFETPRRNRPHPDWPNLIDHPKYGQNSRAVWFGGKQELFEAFE